MVGRFLARRANAAFALVVAVGCGQLTLDAPCRSDEDCGSDERCGFDSAQAEAAIIGPCPYAACSDNSQCATGSVCGPLPATYRPIPGVICNPTVCLPACDPASETTCPADQVCRDTGLCTPLQCDEAGGIVCPESWRCDPEAAKTEPGIDRGSTTMDPTDWPSLISHGCVRKRCTEDGGYVCLPNYACRETELANGTGCVVAPCEETGHCSDDERFICTPTSSLSRANGTDQHGCVFKNCTEGLPCTVPASPWTYCDPSEPTADASGCFSVSCLDGAPCISIYICDPSGPNPDYAGCVPDPARDPGGGSGASGTSGGGASGSAAGGNGAGGTADPRGDSSEGRCIAR